jgi:hypothetical protein
MSRDPTLGKSKATLTPEQRDKLVDLAKNDPGFRTLLKSDWPAAFKQAGIDPKMVKDSVVKESETVPYSGGPAMTGIEITIEIRASAQEERINANDIVVFDKTKTG